MFKLIAFVLITVVFISGEAYCQQGSDDRKIQTISGRVINTDVEGGVINVQTDLGKMEFYFTGVSELMKSSHHMASIEIGRGDPVVIQYTHLSGGKNEVVNLVDSRS